MSFLRSILNTHASFVIVTYTTFHSADNDSTESVDNNPEEFDDINYASMATAQSDELNNPELSFSNQVQLSTCLQPAHVCPLLNHASVA